MKRHAWVLGLVLLAGCGTQSGNTPSESAPPAAAPETATGTHPAAGRPAQPAQPEPARSVEKGAMKGQSTQDVRAEAPKAGRADIARATALPSMTPPGAQPGNRPEAARPAASPAAQTPAPVKPGPRDAASSPASVRVVQTVKADMSALRRCAACHSFTAKSKVGPGLGKGNGIPGVYGRKAGTFPGFRYKFTKYIKGEPWVWDDAHLRQWICDSKQAIKDFTGDAGARTKMPVQRICDPGKQDAVIAALKSIS